MPSGRCASANRAPRRLLDRHGTPTFLDELDEPVRRIEPKLHVRMLGEHMFVCKREKEAAPRAASWTFWLGAWA